MAHIAIPIPENATLLVSEGDSVTFETPFFENTSTETVKITLASSLGFDPEKIFFHLRKFVGDEVKKDTLLAEKKTFLSTRQYLSEYDGTIAQINHYDGSIIIETNTADKNKVSCWFQGTVTEIDEHELILKVKHSKEMLLREEAQADFGGPLMYYDDTKTAEVTDEQVQNCVVCATQLPEFEVIKLEALGATGFLTLHPIETETSLPHAASKQINDFEEAQKKKFTACITTPDRTRIILYD